MTREEFQAGMKEILVFYRVPRTEDERTDFSLYMDGLFRQLSYMEANLFRRTSFLIAGELREDEKKPMVYRFKAVYAKVEEEARLSMLLGPAPAPRPTPEENLEIMLWDAKVMSPRQAALSLDRAAKLGLSIPAQVREILETKVREGQNANLPIRQEVTQA